MIFILGLTGCGDTEREQMTVFSFCGENEQLVVTNGVIVLNNAEEIFYGGDLDVKQEFFSDIASYSTSFYIISGDEKKTILSNSVVDMTGGTIDVAGNLGKVSGDSILTGTRINGLSDLKNNLYFELTTTDMNGEENMYQLQIILKEVTKENDN